ncbi:MAG: serine/threonine-protein kinase [Gemmatimonadetes bacterium]|nr:serine/threonine-protein kinase [Gemmatimonadota bacterium]
MATVYVARDLRHDRLVAVKVLKPDLARALGAERFLQEVRLSAQLEHPHILTLIDSGEADGFLFYVMPYIEGHSLREKLNREGELSIEEAVHILREIADALSYAHGKGVVHRDVKPDNVLFSGGHVVVTDFGIAKAVTGAARDEAAITTAGSTLGTPAYTAPEQAVADKQVGLAAALHR